MKLNLYQQAGVREYWIIDPENRAVQVFLQDGRVSGKTALVFLRYYGCTLCQYDLHQYDRNYSEITKGCGQLLVVLQSSPSSIKEQMGQERFPFELIWITIENSVVRHISGCGSISGWQVCFRTRFASAEGPDGTPANPLA